MGRCMKKVDNHWLRQKKYVDLPIQY